MFRFFRGKTLSERKARSQDIAPDEIFLDASNLPQFDTDQFEGRLERAVSGWSFVLLVTLYVVIVAVFLFRLWGLQVLEGNTYFSISENNRLDHEIIFSRRGLIVDRRGTPLAWNEPFNEENVVSTGTTTHEDTEQSEGRETTFALRTYEDVPGLAHVLGYVSYPQKDDQGFYFQEDIIGQVGVEEFYDEILSGENGRRLTETNATGKQLSKTLIHLPEDGEQLNLSIDARVQSELYTYMQNLASDVGFTGGGGVLLDVTNGEIIALVSFPEFDAQIMTDGDDDAAITAFLTSSANPFLNRAVSGLYTPGSIIKPYVAAGALAEDVISPETHIYSDGALEVPNPFDPDNPTIFHDWKAHGWVDLRDALAVSSNVYFFEVGGGFEDQAGLGIAGIEEYVREFGISELTGIDLAGEAEGTIPSPAWKADVFPGDPWRVGDTYNSAIGQYGFQVTPLQMARAVGAIATGFLVEPHLRLDARVAPRQRISVSEDVLQIVREGMRQGVLEGTAQGLNMGAVSIAAKTGTAELGSTKQEVNSWITGFFPYEKPRYAFAMVMEKGPATNLIGSLFVMRQLFDWMSVNAPEYFE